MASFVYINNRTSVASHKKDEENSPFSGEVSVTLNSFKAKFDTKTSAKSLRLSSQSFSLSSDVPSKKRVALLNRKNEDNTFFHRDFTQ